MNLNLKTAHVLAATVGKRMGISVLFNGQGPCCEKNDDGKYVISMPKIIKKEPGVGFIIHEGFHVEDTDMDVYKAFALKGKMHANILNILEDVRIEHRGSKRYRGARKMLADAANSLDWAAQPNRECQAADVHNWLLYAARRYDMPEVFSEHEKVYRPVIEAAFGCKAVSKIDSAIEKVLKPEATTTAYVVKVAEEIIKILSDASGESGDQQGQSGDASGESGDQQGQSGDASGESGDQQGQSGDASGESGDQQGQSGDASGESGDQQGQSGDASGELGNPKDNLDAKKLFKALQNSDDGQDFGEKLRQKVKGSIGENDACIPYVCRSRKNITLTKPLSCGLVNKTKTLLTSRLQTLTRVNRGLKDKGHQVAFDRLAHAVAANDPYVFQKKSTGRAIDLEVLVLLDASASMRINTESSGDWLDSAYHPKSRAAIAGDAAVVAHNALQGLNKGKHKAHSVLAVFGGSECAIVASGKAVKAAPRVAQGGTPLAGALLNFTPEMLLSRRREKAVFIITDGVPESPSGTTKVIEDITDNGIKVFTIIIGNQSADFDRIFKPSTGIEYVTEAGSIPMALYRAVDKTLS